MKNVGIYWPQPLRYSLCRLSACTNKRCEGRQKVWKCRFIWIPTAENVSQLFCFCFFFQDASFSHPLLVLRSLGKETSGLLCVTSHIFCTKVRCSFPTQRSVINHCHDNTCCHFPTPPLMAASLILQLFYIPTLIFVFINLQLLSLKFIPSFLH